MKRKAVVSFVLVVLFSVSVFRARYDNFRISKSVQWKHIREE